MPEQADDTHLTLLAQVASVMNDTDTRARLRKSDSQQQLYENLMQAIRRLTDGGQ